MRSAECYAPALRREGPATMFGLPNRATWDKKSRTELGRPPFVPSMLCLSISPKDQLLVGARNNSKCVEHVSAMTYPHKFLVPLPGLEGYGLEGLKLSGSHVVHELYFRYILARATACLSLNVCVSVLFALSGTPWESFRCQRNLREHDMPLTSKTKHAKLTTKQQLLPQEACDIIWK